MDESKVQSMSATEALLLDLMGDGERFGLELVATSGGRVKRGSVYVTLTRMEAKGFVESRQEERAPGAIGLPRRLYKATAYGATVREAYQSLQQAINLRPVEAR
jgi:DNA-binding PadR family transcriptional regulator